MYGTIAKLTFRPGTREEAIRHIGESYRGVQIPGSLVSYAYRTDADPDVWYLAVVFDSKEAYWANASKPEQNARYQELRALLAVDPEWHDGDVIQAYTA